MYPSSYGIIILVIAISIASNRFDCVEGAQAPGWNILLIMRPVRRPCPATIVVGFLAFSVVLAVSVTERLPRLQAAKVPIATITVVGHRITIRYQAHHRSDVVLETIVFPTWFLIIKLLYYREASFLPLVLWSRETATRTADT